MGIRNMCLVLKLDNGKVVSKADEQTDRRTKSPSTVYRHIVHKIYTLFDLASPQTKFLGTPVCIIIIGCSISILYHYQKQMSSFLSIKYKLFLIENNDAIDNDECNTRDL